MKNRRLLFMLGLAASWFLALAFRLYHVQVLRHADFTEQAKRQQNRVVTLTPPRGTIYDSRGHELAVSVEAQSIAADPGQIRKAAEEAGIDAEEAAESAAEALAKVLDAEPQRFARLLKADRSFVWLQRKVEPETADAVLALGIDGVILVPESKRYYPLNSLAAQVVGFVGTDNKGLHGLEYMYESVVASAPGRRTVVRDARSGTAVSPWGDQGGKTQSPRLESSAGRPGRDIHLTLDATIQHLVEAELAAAVRTSRAKSGMVVVMDPTTGAILAMASHPTFDPNHFGEFAKKQWRNLPVADAYEPGSTFKMVTLAAALEAGTIGPRHAFDCQMGSIRLDGTLIRDHSPFGVLTVRQIIAKSSNVGAIKLGLAAGPQRLHETIEKFGFGRPTGVDLPSESAGLLRPFAQWSALSPAYYSFGQGLSVTALQLTNAFAAIANGGELLRPYVVARVGRPGEPDHEVRERQVMGFPISPSSVRQIRSILREVVVDGTAKAAAVEGYPAAGKTGTAEKIVKGSYSPTLHISSFVGFAPLHDPAVVVAVILDEPRPRYHGGEVAAPVFQAITSKTLLYLGVTPDPERDHPGRWPGESDQDLPRVERGPSIELASLRSSRSTKPQRRDTRPGTVPDLSGLTARQVLEQSSRLGFETEIVGHGAVARQSPRPGTPLEAAGGRLEVHLTTAALNREARR